MRVLQTANRLEVGAEQLEREPVLAIDGKRMGGSEPASAGRGLP
jgi:hypothetical protein